MKSLEKKCLTLFFAMVIVFSFSYQQAYGEPIQFPSRPGTAGLWCPDGKVLDCDWQCVNASTAAAWINDGYCDDGTTYGMDLTCVGFNYDGSDCVKETCGDGMVYDCALKCVNASTAAAWTNDGYCDDGTYGMILTCPAFDDYDGHDCEGLTDQEKIVWNEKWKVIKDVGDVEFTMGNDDYLLPEEGPAHPVTIEYGIEMWQNEVTAGEYRKCVSEGGCNVPRFVDNLNDPVFPFLFTAKKGSYQQKYDNKPMNFVSWDEAGDFCNWLGGKLTPADADTYNYEVRLPSEAEWEFAARSGERQWLYPWGSENISCNRAVYATAWPFGLVCGTSPNMFPWESGTMEVCSKTDGNSEQGLCDMMGNTWEWTMDDLHWDYEPGGWEGLVYINPATVAPRPDDGSPWIEDNPKEYKVMRGGCALYPGDFSTPTRRYAPGLLPLPAIHRFMQDSHMGFRCVRIKKPKPGASCGDGMIYDCAGYCLNASIAAMWIGNGYCNDGSWATLTCPTFYNDGGDCD